MSCFLVVELAQFFSPDNPQLFKVVHKVFGRSTVSKLLRKIDSTQRKKAVDSLVYEVEARLRNHVNDFMDFVHNLEHRLKEVQQKIDNLKSEQTKYLSPE
ncbi:LOB domain-containing protein 36-like, partial [Trifolium medium]|nr:LOB domain-containing protein 36-like [Trifolium medium]